MMTPRILVVEDDEIVSEYIQRRLERVGYRVLPVVSSGQQALETTREESPDLVLMDIRLQGDMDGVEAAREIRDRFNIPVVYLTAYSDDATLDRAKVTEPYGYILKPFRERELHTTIEMALYKHDIERKLKQSEERFRTIITESADGTVIVDRDGIVRFVNPAAEALLGRTADGLLGEPWRSPLIGGETTELEIVRQGGKGVVGEMRVVDIAWEGGTAHLTAIRDITERKRIEEQMRASLREKEVLLREIHHRVKNNLQVINSLLRLQSRQIEDRRHVEAFRDCQNRIRSMALIHEALYQSEDLANIRFRDYIKSLTTHLFRSYGVSAGKIRLKIEADSLLLGIDLAIPCGLVINELVSNALKHAFPDRREGEIKISLRSFDENQIRLVVSDDGIGVPEDVTTRQAGSLGLHLVTILVEDQLHGEMELDRANGTEFRITFGMPELWRDDGFVS